VLKQVDRILIRVPSVDGAVHYYRDTLGMKLIRHDQRLASFKMGDNATELVLHSDPELPDQATYYLVENVRAIYAKRDELKLRFSSPPQAVSRGFRATAKDPFGNILLLIDRSAGEVAPGAVEDTKAPGALFAGIEEKVAVKADLLIQLYTQLARTADDLPYTPHFESLYRDYTAAHSDPKPTRQEVWRHLLNLRKGGKMPKLGAAKSPAPEVSDEDRARLRDMLGEDIGRRDRLPYSERFDKLVEEFNVGLQRKLSPHLIWRLAATLAK